MLFDFRTITRGRQRRARWAFFLIVIGALALYALTVVQYAFPGHSASWIAWVAGLDVREAPLHPLLTFLGHKVSGMPFASLALRMNLLAVLAGALTVGWIYKVVWFIVFEAMREESAVAHAARIARLGGLMAALTVATSLPFWLAATRFSPEIFDVALIMACAHLLTVYARSENVCWLLLFGALCGVGVAESPVFMAVAPVLALFAVIVEWKLFWCRIGRLFGAAGVAFLLLCATHYFSARFFLMSHGLPPTSSEVFRVVISVFREQVNAVFRLLPKTLWLPVIGLGLGSTLLAFFCSLRTLNNGRTWGLLFLNALLTLSAGLMLFNVALTPWAVMAPRGVLPVLTYALAGMGIGLLVASWRAYSVLDDPRDQEVPDDEDDEDDETPGGEPKPPVVMACRMAGFVAGPVLAALIGVSGLCNGFRLAADHGEFADRAADAVLDGLKGRTWIVSNGLIDSHLLIRAHERGLVAHLLCPYRARERFYTDDVFRSVMADASFSDAAKLRAKSMIAYNFHMFIDDLFATDEAIGSKAVCMGLPDIWYGAKWVPIPERLFYGGVKNAASVDPRTLLSLHVSFWKEWDAFLNGNAGSAKESSYRYRAALRRHFAFVANNLGVTLDDLGQHQEAFNVYLKARAIAPENISALLNIFEMISRGVHPEMKDTIDLELRRKVENAKERYPLWSLSRYYGYVRNYELFVRMGWSWALSSSPGSVLAGLRSSYSIQQDEDRRVALTSMMASLYEMRGDLDQSVAEYKKAIDLDPKNAFAISGLVRLALRQKGVDEAEKVLEQGAFAGVSKRLLRQDWAAVYLVSGDLARARVILQELGDEGNVAPMTLAMLAMVMIEQNETASVETTVLPRLIKSKEGKDSYFVQVVKGRIWQSKGVPGYPNARLCYLRAAALRPDVQALQDVILMMDVALEDQKAAEAHALSILRRAPGHLFANYIIGSIRLEQGQYGDAETFLGRSVKGDRPTLAALNNYAQVLCRIRKLDEAEAVARKATGCAPDRYETWSTLALVLVTKNQLEDAGTAIARARALHADDPRLFLVDGLIAVKRGNRETAEKAAAIVAGKKDLSVADRRELNALLEEIQRLRQK